jgi:hypothetical protein
VSSRSAPVLDYEIALELAEAHERVARAYRELAGPPKFKTVDEWLRFLMQDGRDHHVRDLQNRAYAAGYVNRGKDPDQPQATFNSHMLGRPDKYAHVGPRTVSLEEPVAVPQ